MSKPITKELIETIDEVLSHGLSKGLGTPEKGKMCVEAAICFSLGEPHSDKPSCVGEAVRKAKIVLNDCGWSSNEARAKGMRNLSIAQLGSTILDQEEFSEKLFVNSCKTILVFLIQKHYEKEKDKKLLDWIKKFKTYDNVNELWEEFYNYSYDNYYYYYKYYYYYNNYYYYYYNNYGDQLLLIVADTILMTLKEMNCEGTKWL
jgi:hypothetical protein